MKTGSKASGGANAGTKSRSVRWAVVRFNESKRMFDTGNIKKLVDDGLPSAKDLDAVAEEERIKWLTQKK